jgi:protein gp37
MGEATNISWTDHTFNPFEGCTKVSPGCDNCYAEARDKRWGGDHWGKGHPRKTMSESYWHQPLRWNRLAGEAGRIDKVFCGSLCDVMDDEAPEGQRERLWKLIDQTPNLLWQLLTKRPTRYQPYLPENGFRFDNVILGTTTENQEFFDVRMPEVDAAAEILRRRNAMSTPKTYRVPVKTFASYEPALGRITMRLQARLGIAPDWLIFGGETGNEPRPMEMEWAENIKAECEEFGVAFFMKQVSARTPKQAAALIPAHLLVREFPTQ